MWQSESGWVLNIHYVERYDPKYNYLNGKIIIR